MAKKVFEPRPLDRLFCESLRDIHASITMLSINGLDDEARVEIAAKNLYRLQEVCTVLGEDFPAEIREVMNAVIGRSGNTYPLTKLKKLSDEIRKNESKEPEA